MKMLADILPAAACGVVICAGGGMFGLVALATIIAGLSIGATLFGVFLGVAAAAFVYFGAWIVWDALTNKLWRT